MGTTIEISGKPYADSGGCCVKRVYIIVHEPGRIPEKKIPQQSDQGVTEFLLALEMCHSPDTTYTVVKLVWDGDIWVESGQEWLSMEKIAAPRKFAKLKRKVADEMKRYAAPDRSQAPRKDGKRA